MTLTVEDGTIVANADSYVSLAVYQAYGSARGWTLRDTDADDEVDLRRAFDAINRLWEYKGEEVDLLNQVGKFPRYIIKNRWEYVTPANDIPAKVKDAQCELAYLVKGGLDPFATVDGVIKSAGAGPARVEFMGGASTPRLVAIEGLLAPYMRAGRGQVTMERA